MIPRRLRSTLLEYFPAAVDLFGDLGAADALALLTLAPTPSSALRATCPSPGHRAPPTLETRPRPPLVDARRTPNPWATQAHLSDGRNKP